MSQFCFELVFIVVVFLDCFLELALRQWCAITNDLKAYLKCTEYHQIYPQDG